MLKPSHSQNIAKFKLDPMMALPLLVTLGVVFSSL